ncbi:MAG: hypothetical protein ACLQVG_30755 [Terriglobia bacterium]
MSKPVKWDQEYEQLGGAIEMAEMDASNTDMSCDDEKLVEYYFKQAAQHLALTKSDPDNRAKHLQAGFDHVGKARGLIGKGPVQSIHYRRMQWPFLSPGSK